MRPIEAVCSRKFKAYHDDGDRKQSEIIWIVLHDTEGGSAESVARYFTLPKAGGSTHLVVDDDECFRCLKNTDIPRGAPGANTTGFHIEQCAYARWSATIWLRHRKMLRRAAYKTALHCRLFGIPVTFVTAAGLKRNDPGITTHAECTKAFGGDHTDPGPFWPRRLFMRYVREYYLELTT